MAFDFPAFSSNNIFPMMPSSTMNHHPIEITELSKQQSQACSNPMQCATKVIAVSPPNDCSPQPLVCQPVLPQPILVKQIQCQPPPPPPLVCRPVVCQPQCQPPQQQPTIIKNIIRERAVPTVSDFRRPRRSCSQVQYIYIFIFDFLE